MTSTQNPSPSTLRAREAGRRRALTMIDCPDCLSVDDPADCLTCAGERMIVR